ncbi:hypothetical protein BW247_00915 [Acidihalobacter ferrooxydans]|uniref:OmpA-like domain-containing protein n=2 Tax=Acidihalobacter ferrooxydans TaxID=1765967 RepID=A0A1P8UD89_9GAMM|nr:hypothetical protein BW247_00915 [Acidihalobacter ferrooxydans]
MLRALVLGVGLALPLSAFAMPGYWTNSDGQSWNSTYATGHCWRTPGWQKGDANAQCGAYLMPKPKPVATPAPAPAPAPAPKIITLNAVASGKAYMAWNKAKVTPAQAAKLDRELKSIKMADIKDIKITGYTDRTGPKAYNMKLSKERADNVAKYIENHYNIPADKIQTIGMGPADPVVSCPGTKLTPQLIKCLAPNRRVTVEVDMKVTKTVPAN